MHSYASRAVDRSLPCIAVVHSNCTLLLRLRHSSDLEAADTPSPIEVSDGLVVTAVGYPPDCRACLRQVQVIVQTHKLSYGESPGARAVGADLAQWMTRGLHRAESDREGAVVRPLAASVVLCGLDREDPPVVVTGTGRCFGSGQVTMGALPHKPPAGRYKSHDLSADVGRAIDDLFEAGAADAPLRVEAAVITHGRATLLRRIRRGDDAAALVRRCCSSAPGQPPSD